MIQVVNHDVAQAAQAGRTFASVCAKLERARQLLQVPAPAEARLNTARYEARSAIKELMPLAAVPDHAACLRALHEVRRELPEGGVLRRNLDLFLDGA